MYQEIVFSGSCARVRRGQEAAYSSSNFVSDVFMPAKLGDMAGRIKFSYGNVPARFAG